MSFSYDKLDAIPRHIARPCGSPAGGRYGRLWLPVCMLAGLLLLTPAASADTVTLNLKEADISAVINTVSEVTGKNFIVDPRVRGKITIISSKPMSKDEVYQVFLSVLDVHGFSAVESGNVIKIIPDANAKQLAVPVVDDGRLTGDEVVTRVIELRNISASQLVPILRPLVPQQGHLAAYVPGNILIISDRASNVARMINIIRRIDIQTSDDIEVITLRHASATEIVRILNAMEQQRKAARGAGATGDSEDSSLLIADERTNSILIGGGASGRLRLRTIISHLDTPLETEGNTTVYYLRYAQAKDMVAVLTGVSGSIEQQQQTEAAAPARAMPVNIQADDNTNALVITAPPDVLRALEAVIKQLDIRRAQVMVEGVIAEVSSSFNAELGVQWIADGTPGGDGPVGLSNFTTGTGGSISEIAGAVLTNQIPSIGSGLTLGIGRFDSNNINFAAILRALKSDGSTNILSTPTLVTLDNEEAEIIVGEEVPFVTGSFTTAGTVTSAANPFQTIQRQNVGLTLKVRPQINEGNAVKLDIEQKIDSLSARSDAVDLITNTRSIRTSIIVDDGQIVVLGGLIRDDLQETEQKVPLLGDIPLLGWLFRSKATTKAKTNLMVFLKPTILREDGLLQHLTSGKYDYIRSLQIDMRDKGLLMLPRDEAPVMPVFNEMLALPPTFEQTGAP